MPAAGEAWRTTALAGKYISAVVGDSVLNADGSVTGTDNAPAHRAEMLIALSKGLELFVPPGNYTHKSAILKTQEAVDYCGFSGVPGRTRIFCKYSAQPNSFQAFVFDGKLEVDGISTTPNYYLTSAAPIGTQFLTLNTSVGITPGMQIMLMDMANPVNQFNTTSIVPAAISRQGQVVQVIATDNSPVQNYTIDAGPSVYDSSEGTITLTLTTNGNFGANQIVTLSGLTGTGDYASFNGINTTIARTGGKGVTLNAPTDPALAVGTTITGGTLTFGSLTPNTIAVGAQLEFAYSGDPSAPLTTSTCIRRMTSCPKGCKLTGIIFDYDRLDLNLGTHIRALFRSVQNFLVADCEFWGPGLGCTIDLGACNSEIRNIRHSDGGPGGICLTFGPGAYMHKVVDCIGDGGRHFTNTTAALTTCAAAHIDVIACYAWNYWYSPFTDHPGVRRMRWIACHAVGGRTTQASAFQLRGVDEEVIDCTGSGFQFGVTVTNASGARITGGLFKNNVFGARVQYSADTRFDSVRWSGNSQAHLVLQLVADDTVYATPFPGMEVKDCIVDGVPAVGDVIYALQNPNVAAVWHDSWRLSDIRATGRAVKCIVGQGSTYTTSQTPFPGRFAYGIETMYAAFNVTPGLPATYKCDSVSAVVPATLPTTGRIYGTKYTFKAAKPGANAITLVGTIDGVASPTMSDKQTTVVIDRLQQWTAVSGTFTSSTGLTVLTLPDAVPFGVGVSVTISGATGTGGSANANGTRTTITNTLGKTVRFLGTSGGGDGVIDPNTAIVSFGGYEETT